MRRLRTLLLLLSLFLAVLPTTSASAGPPDDGETAEDAARKIAEARERATAAAEAWTAAQEKLDILSAEKDQLVGEVKALQTQANDLQVLMAKVAVNRYMSVGTTGLPLLTSGNDPIDRAETIVLSAIIHEESAVTMDDYNAVLDDLADKVDEAEANHRDLEAAQVDLDNKQQEALDEVERLKLVERDRLNNDAVLRALEAQRQQQVEAEERLRAEKLKADQALIAQEEDAGSDGGDEGLGAITGNQASGGSSGGTTGGGGSGGRPVGGYGAVYGQGENWVCPVQGPMAFGDTWGEPRSGGRFHQGVDVISPAGTPLVAVVDGKAIARSNKLGGITISFYGNDNNRYYYAHLSGYAALGDVAKGTIIGFVGQTGNAIYSIAHLHFEIHPMGGPAVNPYPTVYANCPEDKPQGADGVINPGIDPISTATPTTTPSSSTTPSSTPQSTAPPSTTPPSTAPPSTSPPSTTPEPTETTAPEPSG